MADRADQGQRQPEIPGLPDEAAGVVHLADNLEVLRALGSDTIDLIYLDPPFNTGRTQTHTAMRTIRDEEGDRVGFAGRRYRTLKLTRRSYLDNFGGEYLEFLEPRLIEAHRVLKPNGTLYFHIDYREVHYCKVLLDLIFGRDGFLNEVIWAYDFGARTQSKWPSKHDNILVYVKDPNNYVFNYEEIDRIPYMAPGLVGPDKAARGKTPTDTWWHTIVQTNGVERTGYPTQKPLGILRRIVRASSPPGGLVLDGFAGSGTTGAACLELGRRFILIDHAPEAIEVMTKRFGEASGVRWVVHPEWPNSSPSPAPSE